MKKIPFLMLATALAVTGPSLAATYTYDLSTEFSGPLAQAPAGSQPWVTATFIDLSGTDAGKVGLTIDATNLVNAEYISEFFFNYVGGSALSNLTFTDGSASSGTIAAPSISKDLSKNKADGGGYYDVQFSFQTSNGDGQFGDNDVWFVKIGSDTGVSASMFNYMSETSGGNGNWYAAAHVQGVGDDASGSGFIGAAPISEPEIYAMMGVGLGLLGWIGRRRKLQVT